MKTLKSLIHGLLLLSFSLFTAFTGCSKDLEGSQAIPATPYSVPAGGNAWISPTPFEGYQMVSEEGIQNWTQAENKVRIYFKLMQAGQLDVALQARVPEGTSELNCTLNGDSKTVSLAGVNFQKTFVGSFQIDQPGYHYIELEGLKKTGSQYAEIKSLQLGGTATEGTMYYVKEDYYWGRRGPSVHLSYQIPENSGDIEWFYNEITVPEGQDVLGSYFMANGFGEGYFGMQVNSETERRVLFSVWSPYQTDDPSTIPDDYKIILDRKGPTVTTGEFGNEGSGGQSFMRFNWKAGTTYRFLLRGRPLDNDFTEYTAYFYAPEVGDWQLIACFKRPHTNTWLTHQYSFLENFITETGAISRYAQYDNQWIYTTNKQWVELTKAKFTADATARKESRMDYSGGVKDGRFFMKNCGFFDETTPIGSMHERQARKKAPEIDFSQLP